MIKIEGKCGITATIVQDSISPAGIRITTFELDYPRFIHSELMTHRMFSRNAASSRAIPVEKMHQNILDNPATPVHWGKNQAGMQAKEELEDGELLEAKELWREARLQAVDASKALFAVGLHKQIANRVTEPFQMMKTIVTATEWDNWYELRNHEDAQPEIHELAKCMQTAHDLSGPVSLEAGEWHVPYVSRSRIYKNGPIAYFDADGSNLNEDEAKMISASCCAQVSYRKSDDSLEKALSIFNRLITSTPRHASPIEHQATPMKYSDSVFATKDIWEEGITHMNRAGLYFSNNLRGWVQFRAIV